MPARWQATPEDSSVRGTQPQPPGEFLPSLCRWEEDFATLSTYQCKALSKSFCSASIRRSL